MKIFTILFIVLFCAAASAQELPRIAVYVTGDVPDNERKSLGTRMLASLVNSKRYKGIERSNSFLAEVEKEQEKQRSGAIDDGQISALGRQFGVKFVCIADITPAYGSFQVSARIINVETAEVDFIGESSSPLKTMDDLALVSDKVVRKMFDEPEPQTRADAAPRKPNPRVSVGAGGFFANDFGGGLKWNSGGIVAMPYYGGGAYIFFDAVYAEIFAGYSAGGGQWKSAAAAPDDLPNMRRAYLNVGAFAKYPFGAGRVKGFPLAGIDYAHAYSGELIYDNDGDNNYSFDGKKERHAAADLSALWVKLGAGIDIELGQRAYLRSELLYGLRTANKLEKNDVNKEKSNQNDAETRQGHGLTLKLGAGINF